ncbi:MAG: hypothetical protein H6812_05370 [Phycisphaeraceae bacterium]|nr:hypothetical protein [Phycisphaerales bacterium]MCB9842671.1 hypothetical protein [Phycisphaeraceae bacterium]
MGPRCPTCRQPVGLKGMAARYRDKRGRRCRRCGTVFTIHAEERSFALAAALVLIILFIGGTTASLLESTIRFRSAWLTIIPYALVLLAVPVGAILGARTRRALPPGDRCAQCGYDITNCTGNECPECGVSFFVKPPLPKND